MYYGTKNLSCAENIKIISGFRDGYIYSFISSSPKNFGQPVTKQAVFYLGEVIGGQVKISDEHEGGGWFEYKQALEKLAGLKGPDGESCQLLKKVNRIVKGLAP